MPRLLLVDDNPSIHKIAESLLSGSDVELTCAESGSQALALVARGEAFDAALVDLFMGEMDGWTLLDALRTHPATHALPVALMAGVLDTVDPERLRQARAQGFLKKPVELRDLVDRVRALVAGGVPQPQPPTPSPFETAPALRVKDLQALVDASPLGDDLLILTEADLLVLEAAQEAEVLPQVTESAVAEVAAEPFGAFEELDAALLDELPEPDLAEVPDETQPATDGTLEALLEGVSELEPPEESLPQEALEEASFEVAPPEAEVGLLDGQSEPAYAEVPVDDLPVAEGTPEALQGDASGSESLEDLLPHEDPEGAPFAVTQPDAEVALLEVGDLGVSDNLGVSDDLGELDSLELEPAPEMPAEPDALGPSLEDSVELPDLGPGPETFTPHAILDQVPGVDELEAPPAEAPEPALPAVPMPSHWDDSEDLLSEIQAALPTSVLGDAGGPSPDLPSTSELMTPGLEYGVGAAMAAGAAAAAAAAPVTDAGALVDALLADPAALERLAKGLAKHLSTQALREVAWEVIPDVADRLRPH